MNNLGSITTRVHALILDAGSIQLSGYENGWNAAIRQVLGILEEDQYVRKCSICAKYGCSTCHDVSERCPCARDGRT